MPQLLGSGEGAEYLAMDVRVTDKGSNALVGLLTPSRIDNLLLQLLGLDEGTEWCSASNGRWCDKA